jgi:hypothetical protein
MRRWVDGKNPLRPIVPERERMYVVAERLAVDAVTVLEDDRPRRCCSAGSRTLYQGRRLPGGRLRSGEDVRRTVEKWNHPASSTPAAQVIERIEALQSHAAPDNAVSQGVGGLVLLDRDGTLIRNIPFLRSAKVEILPE